MNYNANGSNWTQARQGRLHKVVWEASKEVIRPLFKLYGELIVLTRPAASTGALAVTPAGVKE